MEKERVNEKEIEFIGKRNHISYLLEETWSVIMVFLVFIFANEETMKLTVELVKGGRSSKEIWPFLAIFGALLLLLLWHFLRWYRTTISLKDGTVIFERKTLNTKINNIAVSNISNINLEQNLLEMILGTYKVKLDTNSMSTADSTDIKIILKKKDAIALKNSLMQMIHILNTEDAAEENGQEFTEQTENEVPFDIVYSFKEILFSCIMQTSTFLLLFTLGILVVPIVEIQNVRSSGDFMDVLARLAVEILTVISLLGAMVRQWLNDFGFRVRRDKERIYVKSGLIKRRSYAVPVDKINGVVLKYTFIGRIFKRASVKVLNVGGEGDDVDGMKILLAGTYDELEQKLAQILPEFSLPKQESFHSQPKALLAKKLIYNLITVLLLCVIAVAVPHYNEIDFKWYPLCAAGIIASYAILCILGNILSYRATKLYVDEKRLVISRGTFGRDVAMLSYDRIQYVTYSNGPVDRCLNLCKAKASILASSLSREQPIGFYSVEEYQKIETLLKKTY